MDKLLFFILLAALGVIYLVLGNRASKAVSNQTDYYLSGRTLGFFALTVTILATQLGGAALFGAAEEAYQRGWLGILYSAGICMGFLLLAAGIGKQIREQEVTTLPELFEKVYQAPWMRQCAALLSVISLFLILVGQGVATRKFFASIGYDYPMLYLGFWTVLICYTVIGGLKAVVHTDMLQALFIMVSFLGIFLLCFWGQPEITWQVLHTPQSSLSSGSQIPWISWLLMPMLFIIVGQDMGQRCSAAKSARMIAFSTAAAAVLYLMLAFIPVFLGVAAQVLSLEIMPTESVLMASVQALTNPQVSAVCAVALLMAIISTADSLLCAISSNIALDFSWLRTRFPGKEITYAKGITLLVGISAVMASYLTDNIIPLLVQAYSLSISVVFIPLLCALVLKSPSKAVGQYAMLAALASTLFFSVFPAPVLPKEVIALGFAGIAALFAYSQKA